MADTNRTTITLTGFYMDSVENCIGVLGASRAQVITKIVEKFFDMPDNIDYVENLKNRRKIIENKKAEIGNIEEKLEKLLNVSDNIPIKEFLDFLNIDQELFQKYLFNWAEKYDFFYKNGKIVKK